MTASGEWTTVDATLDGRPVLHRKREGVGTPLLLVHGVGPGTTGEANFGPLLRALPPERPAHLIDLVGFGGSPRKPFQPGFDVPLWLEQIGQALDRIGRPALLVGNSVGGALAMRIAARRSDLHGVLAIAAAAASTTATPQLKAFWRAPRDPAELAAAMRPMTADQGPPDPDVVSARWGPFTDAAYAAWFDESLSSPDACLAAAALPPEEAAHIAVPVHLLHGLHDRACPPSPLACLVLDHLPQADLTLFAACGHNVISERTADVLAAVERMTRKSFSK